MRATVPDWAKKRVEYLWDIEEYDPEEDEILDHTPAATLKELGSSPVIDGERFRLVLVRTVASEGSGVHKQEWAYAVRREGRWVLPESFDEGTPVPKQFHVELARSGL